MSSLTIKIKFSLDHPNDYQIESDVKPERYIDVLTEYLQDLIGDSQSIEDEGDAADLTAYTVRINLDLRTDTYTVTSDTENAGLTTGIIMFVVADLNQGKENEQYTNQR